MANFVAEVNGDLEQADKTGVLDPSWITAKACDRFVNIHPFLDGNGRACRLILNVILLKYVGVICELGGDG